MMSIESRSRVRLLLAGLAVLACFVVPAHHASSFSLAFVGLGAGLQRPLARAGRSLAASLDALPGLWSAARENRRLRAEVARLKEELDTEKARSAQKDERLSALEELRPLSLNRRRAEVIGEGAGPQKGLLFLDRGSTSGVEKGMVVVAGRSVVGRVRAVSPTVSSVLLVTAAGSGFDGVVLSTGERGVLAGNGDGTMALKYISRSAPKAGDPVLTRARDRLVPGNLLLGRVSRVERQPGALTYEVIVRPVRDLDLPETVDIVWPAGAVVLPVEPAGRGTGG